MPLHRNRNRPLPDATITPIWCKAGDACAVVDPSEPGPVKAALAARGWRLTHILNTHHHLDHTGGNLALKQEFGAMVVGPGKDAARIPGHGYRRGRSIGLGVRRR